MDFWMASAGTYLSTYNADDSPSEIKDGKSGETFPGDAKERRAILRKRLYKRSRDKPRIFVYTLDANGDKVLVRSYIRR